MKIYIQHSIKCILLSIALISLKSQHVKAQPVWGKQYTSNIAVTGSKGAYSSQASGFVSTGNTQLASGKRAAYILETDINGNIQYQVFLGDVDYNFYGISVIESSTGAYVVVGKTDKGQTYEGAYSDTCVLNSYYNAFIAYVNPSNPTFNWLKVFGNPNLHDEALEVIEDQYGDLVITGISNGYLSADSCPLNNPLYVSASGSDKSDVLFSKFDASGNQIFNKSLHQDRYDRGISLVEDITTNTYNVIGTRRRKNQTNYTYPIALQTDYAGNLTIQNEFATNTNVNIKPFEIVKYNGDFVIVGHVSDVQGVDVTSFVLVLDANLYNQQYGQIVHNYNYLLFNDIIVDNDTLVVSASTSQQPGNTWTEQSLTKLLLKTNRQPQLTTFIGTYNLVNYHSFFKESNVNLCSYPRNLPQVNGFHLFGNSQNKIDAVSTDHLGLSMCHELDTITMDSIEIDVDPYSFSIDSLDIIDTLGILPPNLIEYSQCDTLALPMPKQPNSVRPFNKKDAISLYPNPALNHLNIQIDRNMSRGTIVITDMLGRSKLTQKLTNSSQELIDISVLPPGSYLLTINNQEEIYHQKFQKE